MFKIAKNKITYLIILFLSYALVLGGLYVFLGRRLLSYSNELRNRLVEQSKEIEETKNLIKAIPNPDKEIANVEEKIRELRDKAVTKEQVPRIIQQLTRRSSELNINIVSIKPLTAPEESGDKLIQAVNKVYIEVVMSCPYPTMGDYLKALTELPILFTVESIVIENKEDVPTSASKKAPEVLVNLLLSTYMVLEL
jgi:Tfp pilus assembly protein PilO